MLVSEERPVAGGTGGDASSFLFGLTGRIKPQRFSAGADDDGMGQEGLALNHHLVGTFAQINLVDVLVFDFKAEAFCLFSQLHHHFRAGDAFGVAGEIFDIAGEHQLPSGHVACEHQGVEHGSASVETGRVACRSRTDDDDVTYFGHVTLQAFVRNGGV